MGNLETLSNEKGDIWPELKDFYDNYYSADRMGLSLIGPNSLDELEELATSIFSGVPYRETKENPVVPVLLPDNCQMWFQSLKWRTHHSVSRTLITQSV